MFFNLEVHGCALNFIHNIYLFLTDGAWVEKSFVFQIWGWGGSNNCLPEQDWKFRWL